MYKKNLFGIILLVGMMSLVSCNKDTGTDVQLPQNAKEYVVSVGCGGEVSGVTISDLTKADSGNDLYGIQVYSKVAEGNGTYVAYAYGLFSSLENVSIKLLEGYKYKFVATLVVDGKERLSHVSGKYYLPFSFNLAAEGHPSINANFSYSKDTYMNYLSSGTAMTRTDVAYKIPNLDRYYGELSDYAPSEGGNVTIEMKRTAFGLKVVADGLTEGSLSVKMDNAPEIAIVSPAVESEDIFTFNNVSAAWQNDDYKETISISFSWTKADGVIVPIATQSFDFYRNKKTTITVKVEDKGTDNGVGVITEDSPIGEGGSYSI